MAVLGEKTSKKSREITLSVKDTDFLLKLIMKSTFEGSELEIAHTILQKLVKLHRINLNED